MTTYRDLLNPTILNNEWVGFFGDSEFINKNGELIMGAWTFNTLFDGWLRDVEYPTLDTEVDEDEISKGNHYVELFNDNGDLCGVEFLYGDD